MGAGIPKQFLLLGGKPILRVSIERFLEAIQELHIITVLPENHIRQWRNYCIREGFTCPQKIVTGGFTRFHSVKNALEKVPAGAIVGIHDAVRPLISADCIRALFSEAETWPAVIPVVPSFDTLKYVENPDGGAMTVAPVPIDRSKVYGAQTPQVFHSSVIKEAYNQSFDVAFTDDASVAAAYGVEVRCLPGERTNIKITTPEDLALAERLLK